MFITTTYWEQIYKQAQSNIPEKQIQDLIISSYWRAYRDLLSVTLVTLTLSVTLVKKMKTFLMLKLIIICNNFNVCMSFINWNWEFFRSVFLAKITFSFSKNLLTANFYNQYLFLKLYYFILDNTELRNFKLGQPFHLIFSICKVIIIIIHTYECNNNKNMFLLKT